MPSDQHQLLREKSDTFTLPYTASYTDVYSFHLFHPMYCDIANHFNYYNK